MFLVVGVSREGKGNEDTQRPVAITGGDERTVDDDVGRRIRNAMMMFRGGDRCFGG